MARQMSADNDESITNGGVYAPRRPRKVLFSDAVEFRTIDLPRRKPRFVSDESLLAVVDSE